MSQTDSDTIDRINQNNKRLPGWEEWQKVKDGIDKAGTVIDIVDGVTGKKTVRDQFADQQEEDCPPFALFDPMPSITCNLYKFASFIVVNLVVLLVIVFGLWLVIGAGGRKTVTNYVKSNA